ncbi:MAG: hypothetical protein JEY71_10835 [Sphaerochaeta sp.]|nr:hypothetical protein [Sphaerochaeta sp.]
MEACFKSGLCGTPELDALRTNILVDLRSYSSWLEADVVFTLDPSWVPLAMPLAVASV